METNYWNTHFYYDPIGQASIKKKIDGHSGSSIEPKLPLQLFNKDLTYFTWLEFYRELVIYKLNLINIKQDSNYALQVRISIHNYDCFDNICESVSTSSSNRSGWFQTSYSSTNWMGRTWWNYSNQSLLVRMTWLRFRKSF